jgi:PAS domain S-box-containing protein
MASVADYLTRYKAGIVRRYNEECGKLPPARGLTPEELMDTLPEYLGALVDISRQGREEGPPADVKRRLERTHVRIRLRAGYREEEVLNEYVILGRLIASTWEGAPPEEQPAPEDAQRLFEGLQSAMDGVVQSYTGYTVEDRQREKRFLRRLDALSPEALGEGTNPAPFEERLEPLLAIIQEAMEADGVALFLVEEDGKGLPLTASTGLGAAPRGSYRTEVGAPSFVGQLAALDEPLQLTDASAPSEELPAATRRSGLGTLLGVRIQPFGKLMGVLFLGVRSVRPFTPRDERYLETFVEYLSGILGKARLFERVRQAEARYRLATQALTAAIWEWNLRTDSLHWSEGVLKLLGHRPEALGTSISGWADNIHPEDRRRVEEGIHAVIDGGGTHWRDEYRFRHGDGRWLVVLDAGVVERDAQGVPVRMVGAMQDVTLQRQAEEARRESEALLWLVVDNVPVLINFVDTQQRYVLNNQTYRDWFGVEPKSLKGKLVREVVGEENYARLHPILERVLAGEQVEYETPFVFGGGRRGHVEGTYVPYRNSKGQVQGFVALVQDVTARRRLESERENALAAARRAQAEAEAERQKLHDIFQQAPVIITILEGPEHTYTFANPAHHRLLGNRNVVGMTLAQALPGPEGQRFRALLDEVVRSGKPYVGHEVPFRLPRQAADEEQFLNFVYQPMRDADGQVHGVLVCAFEVTEQVLARRRAEGLSAQLETILKSFPEPLYVAEATGITRTNAAGLSLLGVTSVEELNRDIALLHQQSHVRRADTGEPLPPEDNLLVRALEGHTGFLDFIVRDLSTGRDRVMHGAAAPVRVGGQVVGAVSVSTDITERTVAERSLRERANFEQQLIGIVGHDLRSPLQSILLSAIALSRQEELDSRAMRNVTRIRTAAERADRMIRDLLDFTQARLGGGIPIERKEVDVHALIREVVDEMEANFPERALQVTLEGERHARLDRDRMAQLLTNLLSNALKYSPEASPVRVRAEGTPEALVLTVQNAGEPVPAERLPHIFKPMQRATHQEDKTGRSVGLGLFIVRHLVEAHGGTVQVSSSLEEGTTFTVRIPKPAVGRGR